MTCGLHRVYIFSATKISVFRRASAGRLHEPCSFPVGKCFFDASFTLQSIQRPNITLSVELWSAQFRNVCFSLAQSEDQCAYTVYAYSK